MATYRIVNTMSGQDLGTYEASSKADALEQLAKFAGYQTFAEACETTSDDGRDLEVTEVERP
jgi:hypothetical protein